MGGNSSSHHVSFGGSDEDGVTFLKGIRLSERVIDRMKESPRVASTKSSKQTTTPPEAPTCLVPDEQRVPIIPHPPSYVSTLVPPLSEPVTPVAEETSTPPSPVESPEGFPATPPTGQEHVIVFPAVPEPQPVDLPAEPINVPSPMSSDPINAPQLVEPSNTPVEPLTPPPVITSTTEPVAIPPSPTADSLTEPLPSSDKPVVLLAEPIELLETPSFTSSAAEITSADLPVDLENSAFPASIPDANPSVSVEEPVLPSFIDQTVNEEELRKQIREDLQKLLNEEMKIEERNIRQQLEEEKTKAKAQAQAAAQIQIQEEVQKLLVKEKTSYQQILADAIKKEQLSAQDENLITQYYWMERKAQKLKEKEKYLENQDALFQQQIAKMQEKMAQFSKVTAESHKKGLEDAHNRFRRYQIKPVCSDLQRQILKCYAENKGQTMSCSNIASQYIQCVDRAKQDKKLSTGG